MKTNLRAIILAAGRGERMKSDLPKVLHRVAGKPMLVHVVDAVSQLGSLKICVVLGHEHNRVKAVLDKKIATTIQKERLGTADAVRSAVSFLKSHRGDVLILCGDTPLLSAGTLKRFIQKHKAAKAACTILTAEVLNPDGYGRIVRDLQGRVVAIREEKDAVPREKRIREINAGAYCFKAAQLAGALKRVSLSPHKKEFYLTDVVQLLEKEKAVIATLRLDDPQEGLGINTREELMQAEVILRKRILKSFLEKGVSIIDPQTTYIAADARIGQDTIIRPLTIIENNVQIGRRCVIGPFARLRSGTRLGNNVEVGNFAEVSRSMIGDGSWMKHFSFLGDARVGKSVNIGAGVVTANFDGKNKNVTQIKDQAFVGSDSILIAPVTVGKKGITAAGCVVTKGKKIPDGGIALGVPARIIGRGGKRL